MFAKLKVVVYVLYIIDIVESFNNNNNDNYYDNDDGNSDDNNDDDAGDNENKIMSNLYSAFFLWICLSCLTSMYNEDSRD